MTQQEYIDRLNGILARRDTTEAYRKHCIEKLSHEYKCQQPSSPPTAPAPSVVDLMPLGLQHQVDDLSKELQSLQRGLYRLAQHLGLAFMVRLPTESSASTTDSREGTTTASTSTSPDMKMPSDGESKSELLTCHRCGAYLKVVRINVLNCPSCGLVHETRGCYHGKVVQFSSAEKDVIKKLLAAAQADVKATIAYSRNISVDTECACQNAKYHFATLLQQYNIYK